MSSASNVAVSEGQTNFLMQGGVMMMALRKMRAEGQIQDFPVRLEYPKQLRLVEGTEVVECSTEIGNGSTRRTWKETRDIVRVVTVNSEDEEERVMSGGKTSAQVEQDRQDLLMRCRNAGMRVDPSWSAVRLRRELGEKMEEPEPVDRVEALQAELAKLRQIKEMKAEIVLLKAALSRQEEPIEDDVRAELAALGVRIDGRWSDNRCREELERATAPKVA